MTTTLQRREHDYSDKTEKCWCHPALVDNGLIVVHNDELGVYLGTYAVLEAEWEVPPQSMNGSNTG